MFCAVINYFLEDFFGLNDLQHLFKVSKRNIIHFMNHRFIFHKFVAAKTFFVQRVSNLIQENKFKEKWLTNNVFIQISSKRKLSPESSS